MEKSYLVYAKRRFDKINGNTYHSVEIKEVKQEDGKLIFSFLAYIPFSYGYDDQFKSTAIDRLKKNGHLTEDKPYNRFENIEFTVIDVQRKKDL